MLSKLKSNLFLLILGIILAGVFLPTIIGDTNNRLIVIPAILGLLLIGYSIGNYSNKKG
jgi:hypothetical protein